MTAQLHKNAQKVQQSLIKHQLSCDVVELPSSTRTAADAAASIGCNIAQIAKSLIFRADDQPVLLILSGPNRLHEKRAKRELGLQLERADADWVKIKTGFPIGGIPPLGHDCAMQVFIDADLLGQATIWAAAGTPNAVFEIDPKQLAKITAAQTLPESAIKPPS